jgi:hypothetical protein
MINAGFPVVDPGHNQQLSRTGLGLSFDGSLKAFSELASNYEVEVMIIGDISKEFIGETDGIFACRAYLRLRVVRADTGQFLVSQTLNDRGVDLNQNSAFQKAMLKVSDRAVNFLREQLGKQLVDSARIVQVTVNNVNYPELQQLHNRLKGLPNVSNVFLRNFSNKNALLDLETGLLAEQLAEIISSWTDLNIVISSISGSKISLIQK